MASERMHKATAHETDVNTIRTKLLQRIRRHDAIIGLVPTYHARLVRDELISLARELGWDRYLPSRPI